jgi:hypothetical protein
MLLEGTRDRGESITEIFGIDRPEQAIQDRLLIASSRVGIRFNSSIQELRRPQKMVGMKRRLNAFIYFKTTYYFFSLRFNGQVALARESTIHKR